MLRKTDTNLSSMCLHHNGMPHLKIPKFHPSECQDPPVQEHQFGLFKIPAGDHLTIQNKLPKIINEVLLQFHFICWLLSKLQTLLSGHLLPTSRDANMFNYQRY